MPTYTFSRSISYIVLQCATFFRMEPEAEVMLDVRIATGAALLTWDGVLL